MGMLKIDIEWNLIFEDFKILETIKNVGLFVITSKQINNYHQARLMTKFDHQTQRPRLFVEHNLSILPISRGSYVIGNFDTFCKFTDNKSEVKEMSFPYDIESIDPKDITSEATAINCAFVSNILHDFTDESNLRPTVNGRMSSKTFNFKIDSKGKSINIEVDNSQIEIDGGFEGDYSLNLIEAKTYISNDFLIRQLYYPFQLWNYKINKKVRPIFLTYTNGIFDLREYTFDDPKHYNSLRLVKQKKYSIKEELPNEILNIEYIENLLNSVKIVNEPKIPFPQADSFERVINLLEILNFKLSITGEELLANYDFVSGTKFHQRQINYYTDAARYLGFVCKTTENKEATFQLTELGITFFNLSIFERQLKLIKCILSHRVFNEVLRIYFNNGEMPKKKVISEIMKSSILYNIDSESTYLRRASTISSWVNWIIKQIEV
jgi:hypothetical protein